MKENKKLICLIILVTLIISFFFPAKLVFILALLSFVISICISAIFSLKMIFNYTLNRDTQNNKHNIKRFLSIAVLCFVVSFIAIVRDMPNKDDENHKAENHVEKKENDTHKEEKINDKKDDAETVNESTKLDDKDSEDILDNKDGESETSKEITDVEKDDTKSDIEYSTASDNKVYGTFSDSKATGGNPYYNDEDDITYVVGDDKEILQVDKNFDDLPLDLNLDSELLKQHAEDFMEYDATFKQAVSTNEFEYYSQKIDKTYSVIYSKNDEGKVISIIISSL